MGFLFAESRRLDDEATSSKLGPFIHRFTEEDVVLDLGCGVGIELSVIGNLAHCVVGLDIDPDVLSVAKKALHKETGNNVELIRADAFFLPFKPSSFSKLICTDLLEHLREYTKLVGCMKEVLCTEGDCLIRIPNKWTIDEILLVVVSLLRPSKSLWNVRHVSFFDLHDVVGLFSCEGFAYVDAFTKGCMLTNAISVVLAIASVLLTVLFHGDYYKVRYYFIALSKVHSRAHTRIFRIRSGSLPKMPLFNYMTVLFKRR